MTIITNRQEYYKQPYTLFNMIPRLKYRYLNARKVNENNKPVMVRYYFGYNLDLLKQSLDKLNVLKDTSAKLYFDLAKFKDEKGNTPMFNFNNEQRKDDKDDFNETYYNYMFSFDFVIDLDSDKDVMIAWKDAKKIKKLFDKYKLPYSCKFSGSRGIHFLIDDIWFNPKMKPQNKVLLYGRLAKIISAVCGIKEHNKGGTFDDSIYDDRRIFKLDYSLNFKDGKEYICLPLDDEQFNNFKLSDMELMNVMKNVKFTYVEDNKLKSRGFLERNHGLTAKELKTNLTSFIKEML